MTKEQLEKVWGSLTRAEFMHYAATTDDNMLRWVAHAMTDMLDEIEHYQGKADEAADEADGMEQDLVDLKEEMDEIKNDYDVLQDEMEALQESYGELEDTNMELQSQLDRIHRAIGGDE